MGNPVELTIEEATAIARAAAAEQGFTLEALDPTLRMATIAGVMNIANALQRLGYRIARPLKVAD